MLKRKLSGAVALMMTMIMVGTNIGDSVFAQGGSNAQLVKPDLAWASYSNTGKGATFTSTPVEGYTDMGATGYKINIDQAGTSAQSSFHSVAFQLNAPLQADVEYKLSFKMKASEKRTKPIMVYLSDNELASANKPSSGCLNKEVSTAQQGVTNTRPVLGTEYMSFDTTFTISQADDKLTNVTYYADKMLSPWIRFQIGGADVAGISMYVVDLSLTINEPTITSVMQPYYGYKSDLDYIFPLSGAALSTSKKPSICSIDPSRPVAKDFQANAGSGRNKLFKRASVTNSTEQAINPVLLLGLYKTTGEMIDLKLTSETVLPGETKNFGIICDMSQNTPYFYSGTENEMNVVMKAFLWSGIDSIEPISNMEIIHGIISKDFSTLTVSGE